jgi:hypothetical protein
METLNENEHRSSTEIRGWHEMRSSEDKTDLYIERIMTTKVRFYDDAFKGDLKKFCKDRNITYLPSKNDPSSCYKLSGNRFQKEKIQESQKVDVKDYVFDNAIREKFEAHKVLFVFRKTELAGIIHFCDYNRDPVSIYAYALLLKFERNLRELLISHNLTNRDMLDFFEKHRRNPYYSSKVDEFNEPQNRMKMRELEPFQMFDLKDLICLLNSKKVYRVPVAINDDLRNTIMHTKNVVRHENYEKSGLIYNVASFSKFFYLINLLRSESEKVPERIRRAATMKK